MIKCGGIPLSLSPPPLPPFTCNLIRAVLVFICRLIRRHRRQALPPVYRRSTARTSQVTDISVAVLYFHSGFFYASSPTTMIHTSSDRTAMVHLRIKILTFKTKGVLSPILNLHVYVTNFLSIFNIVCF